MLAWTLTVPTIDVTLYIFLTSLQGKIFMSFTNERSDAGLYVPDLRVNAIFDLALFVFHSRSSKVCVFWFVRLFVLTQDFKIMSTQANSCVFKI